MRGSPPKSAKVQNDTHILGNSGRSRFRPKDVGKNLAKIDNPERLQPHFCDISHMLSRLKLGLRPYRVPSYPTTAAEKSGSSSAPSAYIKKERPRTQDSPRNFSAWATRIPIACIQYECCDCYRLNDALLLSCRFDKVIIVVPGKYLPVLFRLRCCGETLPLTGSGFVQGEGWIAHLREHLC